MLQRDSPISPSLGAMANQPPGWGEPGFRGGPCPGLVVLLLFTVILDLRL